MRTELIELFGTAIPASLLQLIVSFLIIAAVLGAFAWLLRSMVQGGGGLKRRRPQNRLAVISNLALDSRRRLVLIRRDNKEHLLLIGGTTELIVEQNITLSVQEALSKPELELPQTTTAATMPHATTTPSLLPPAPLPPLGKKATVSSTPQQNVQAPSQKQNSPTSLHMPPPTGIGVSSFVAPTKISNMSSVSAGGAVATVSPVISSSTEQSFQKQRQQPQQREQGGRDITARAGGEKEEVEQKVVPSPASSPLSKTPSSTLITTALPRGTSSPEAPPSSFLSDGSVRSQGMASRINGSTLSSPSVSSENASALIGTAVNSSQATVAPPSTAPSVSLPKPVMGFAATVQAQMAPVKPAPPSAGGGVPSPPPQSSFITLTPQRANFPLVAPTTAFESCSPLSLSISQDSVSSEQADGRVIQNDSENSILQETSESQAEQKQNGKETEKAAHAILVPEVIREKNDVDPRNSSQGSDQETEATVPLPSSSASSVSLNTIEAEMKKFLAGLSLGEGRGE